MDPFAVEFNIRGARCCEGCKSIPGRGNTKLQEEQAGTLQEVIRVEDRLNIGGNLAQDGQRLMLCRDEIKLG